MEAQIFMLNNKKRGIHKKTENCREWLISLHDSAMVSTRNIVTGRLEVLFLL